MIDNNKREYIAEMYGDDMLFMDGPAFDEAILGVASIASGNEVVAYDVNKVLETLEKDGMSYEEALEYFDFNIACAYVGEKTPAFIYTHDYSF